MTHFIKQGDDFYPTTETAMDIRNALPVGTYVVKFNPMRNCFYLEQTKNLTTPPKLYGNIERLAQRIFNTFQTRSTNTGALLTGEKGSGKSMTMRVLSQLVATVDMPTILINDEFSGDEFNTFVTSIEQPIMLAFDEFEKTYDEKNQMAILTLLDGVFTSRKLFVFTTNDNWKVTGAMRNRPGRLFYNVKYGPIDDDAIREYCTDNLNGNDTARVQGIIDLSRKIDAFNFDMLKALVEEMNRYNESAKEAVQYMNIRPEDTENITYAAEVMFKGKPVHSMYGDTQKNPLAERTRIWACYKFDGLGSVKTQNDEFAGLEVDGDEQYGKRELILEPSYLVRQDEAGSLYFKIDDFDIIFRRTVYRGFDYNAF